MGIEMNKANSLEFTLAIGCALNCNYCPQEKLINRYKEHKCKVMEFDTFTKALTRIKPGGGVIISGIFKISGTISHTVAVFHQKEWFAAILFQIFLYLSKCRIHTAV